MLTLRDHQTGDLFDPWAYLGEKRCNLLKRSWAGVFRQHLLEHLPVGKLARCFHVSQGRPSKDAYMAIGVLLLQQLHDLTDVQTVEALAFNIAWHYALDIRDESDAYLCEKTLRNYRRLVINQNLEQLLFQSLTDQLIKAFDVDTSKQRLDSTALRSFMRSLTRLGVVVEAISKFLRELAHQHPDLHACVDRDLIRRYVHRVGEGCFAHTKPSESKRRLPESGRDLLALSQQFASTPAASLESFVILERVLAEQFEVIDRSDKDGEKQSLRTKESKEIPCDNVRNPADPDSSYNKHRGQGYMLQVMETYQEDDGNDDDSSTCPDLITHVATHKMTIHDGNQLEPALTDVAQRDVQPEMLLSDSHYGWTQNVVDCAESGVELVSPAMAVKGSKQGKLTLEQFTLADDGRVSCCPVGHKPIATSMGVVRIQARFDTAACKKCELHDQCFTRTAIQRGEGSRFQYTHQRVKQRARRLDDQSSVFKQRYRWRAGIEATMSRLKHPMGLARLRIRGMQSVTYTATLRALGLNIHRCAAVLAAA